MVSGFISCQLLLRFGNRSLLCLELRVEIARKNASASFHCERVRWNSEIVSTLMILLGHARVLQLAVLVG
jgi:hypothetical protein